MAKGVYRLTARDLKRKTPGTYGDGLGLWLQISTGKYGTNRSWEFRYTANGRPRYMGLGSVHTIGLTKARELARECRELRLRDIDPIEDRKQRRPGALCRSTNAPAPTWPRSAASGDPQNMPANGSAHWRGTSRRPSATCRSRRSTR